MRDLRAPTFAMQVREKDLDWSEMKAPALEEFERIAKAAFDELPEDFRARCTDVIIRVEDFPGADVMTEMELESPFDILGLYHGVSEPNRSVLEPTHFPDMVFLYRRPMLDYWTEYDETLGDIIRHVLIHEIGHHMGFSDDDMHAIERGTP